ncbi:MAG: FAD:protein FMN transferase [Rhodospirillaceae bacterium]|jgi:FAD:protein FMN transferase|nr:FAD:protein FMN transferase [Rhodospirillaceae bacterium]MBT5414789.1 FAD:protein FMN transferase [Rhodospirillaceae bacterium]
MDEKPNVARRRFFRVLAGAAALPLVGAAAARASGPPRLHWQGRALGAESRMTFEDGDRNRVRRALALCLDEIARLEAIFSLHRPNSELVRLNALGRLDRPSLDLRSVLAEAERVVSASAGAFDPTVQPLWRKQAAGPAVSRDPIPTRDTIGWVHVAHGARTIAFGRPGMALTLNGIAQGLVADRIADLLRDMGFERVLVELGETVGLAPENDPWRIGLPGGARLALADGGIATSAPRVELPGIADPVAHLIDPETGRPTDAVRAATAWAPRAMTADALSTAAAIAPDRAVDLAAAFAGAGLRILRHDGSAETFGVPKP